MAMNIDVETVAFLANGSVRLSLILFCLAFVVEAMPVRAEVKRAWFWPFIIVQFSHLVLLAVHFAVVGYLPDLSLALFLALPLLLWGLINYIWVIITIRKRWGRGGALVVPVYVTWYLWLLFVGTHALGLMDPERASAVDGLLLAVTLVAAVARIVLQLKPR